MQNQNINPKILKYNTYKRSHLKWITYNSRNYLHC